MRKLSEEHKFQKIQERSLATYDDMVKWAAAWNTYPEWKKTSKARMYYMMVHDSPKIESGLISSAAWKGPKKLNTKDHITVPQIGGFMMLDNWDGFIRNDEERFHKMFIFHCFTIKLTKDENTALKKYSAGNNQIKCTFIERYKRENIELRVDYQGSVIPIDEALENISAPWYTEMEKKYIV